MKTLRPVQELHLEVCLLPSEAENPKLRLFESHDFQSFLHPQGR
jgi:hypothetical protein